MKGDARLIERGFCLKQASLDSVHEKNVRHGHLSTLHIWPARRPLAASRAALVATLLPDPGTAGDRNRLLERLGGTVEEKVEEKRLPGGRVVATVREETRGGILHWGREASPELERFREEILRANGGRPPRVLDPFAGGGAIPLEAMRLGAEVTAVDINPVAWFILKCTLEYPHRMAGLERPLPAWTRADAGFMESFIKAHPDRGPEGHAKSLGPNKGFQDELVSVRAAGDPLSADLAWHLRAWGQWVLKQAIRDLARFYPAYADYQPLKGPEPSRPSKAPKRVPIGEDGTPDAGELNRAFDEAYLADAANPRWVPKPTVAYLWARTVRCKNCRATVPLLKTRWLAKKEKKRVLLTMEPNAERTGVVFGVEYDVPQVGSNAAQRREHDRRIGEGTMSRSGARCPLCRAIMTMEDLRLEGQAGRIGSVMTAVVVEGPKGKEYRRPMPDEVAAVEEAEAQLEQVFREVPFGVPDEPLPTKEALGFRVPLYGLDRWSKLFSPRQLLTLGTFVKWTRAVREAMEKEGYPPDWIEAVWAYLALAVNRLADYSSAICSWHNSGEKMGHTFARFALPIVWDYAEVFPLSEATGGYPGAVAWIARFVTHALPSAPPQSKVEVLKASAVQLELTGYDIVITDPPYYDAIPYSDLMDFFYVWLRRSLSGMSDEVDRLFAEPLGPKWDDARQDGELIDDSSRHGGDKTRSREAYENGMFRAFQACYGALKPEGRMVIVFAHKHPDAWESLVGALIQAGFVVNGSWPIQTEMGTRSRARASAALSSSVWLVCRKRPEATRPGWDNRVTGEMEERIRTRLREFWDAGIRGPDFVWAATGPALEAYSKYPAVRKANTPGELMTVSEFLRTVRRMVVDFVVGRVLSGEGDASVSGLDDATTYYLLHRHDFGMEEAPAGACILYAVSCGLSDKDLVDRYDVLVRGGRSSGAPSEDEGAGDDDNAENEATASSGSAFKLKPWHKRARREAVAGASERPAPLIDQAHGLMHLWTTGDVGKVDGYIERRGLRRNRLFHQVLQALIELAPAGSEERALLEKISNHLAIQGRQPEGLEQTYMSIANEAEHGGASGP